MLDAWKQIAFDIAGKPESFYCGCRKIITDHTIALKGEAFFDQLGKMEDFGYTKAKMKHLERLYFHEESVEKAIELWDARRKKGKYGSVGFTCYNHFVKVDPNKISKRASVMGPCLQSVILTHTPKRETRITVFYRTTEIFKKFPADLVFLRDFVLPRFNFTGVPVVSVTMNFANVTVHPMYAGVLMPHLVNPVEWLEDLKIEDKRFWVWTVRWTSRYLLEEHANGIQKFSQALRTQAGILTMFEDKPKVLARLRNYLSKNHPGGGRWDADEGEDE